MTLPDERKRKEITNWFKIISEANLKSLQEMVRVGKLTQEAYQKQMLVEWRPILQMQLSVLQHLQEVDKATIAMVLKEMRNLELTNLMEVVKASTFAYQNYMESIQGVYGEALLKQMTETSRAFSLAYANTILSYRTFVEPKPKPKIEVTKAQNQVEENVAQDIDSLLRQLDPDFVTMRTGAWTTFNAKSPDHLRQSIASMRELLNHVLRSLSPGSETRKDRIRVIMSGNGKEAAEVDFVESIAEYVDKLYDILSKIAHTVYKDELCVEMTLRATEAVLVVLLKRGIMPK